MQLTTISTPSHSTRQHAVVIGASIAGLLAAHTLSAFFEHVTIIERDTLTETPFVRKGVSQGKHIHLLLHRGAKVLESLFPDLLQTLEAEGMQLLNMTEDFHWFHFGKWKRQFPGPVRIYGQSRPLLEYHIRRLVTSKANVRVLDTHEVQRLIKGPTGIAGVYLRHRGSTEPEAVYANLVVDASGRGSQTPHWLTELGYPSIAETQIKIGVGYASRMYRRPDVRFDWKVLGIAPWPLETTRSGYLFPIEGNAWIATLSGFSQANPPADEAGFLDFARNLAKPDIYEAIKNAEPLGPIAIHKVPSDRRRYYERSQMPDGLIVLGDAVCSFNPIYGQGMTVAALETQLLFDHLQQQRHSQTMKGFSLRFQKALAKILEVPWQMATSEDLRYSSADGKNPFGLGMLQKYTERVGKLCASDPFATQTFYEVMNMLKPPSALFHPRILLPALWMRSSVLLESG